MTEREISVELPVYCVFHSKNRYDGISMGARDKLLGHRCLLIRFVA